MISHVQVGQKHQRPDMNSLQAIYYLQSGEKGCLSLLSTGNCLILFRAYSTTIVGHSYRNSLSSMPFVTTVWLLSSYFSFSVIASQSTRVSCTIQYVLYFYVYHKYNDSLYLPTILCTHVACEYAHYGVAMQDHDHVQIIYNIYTASGFSCIRGSPWILWA